MENEGHSGGKSMQLIWGYAQGDAQHSTPNQDRQGGDGSQVQPPQQLAGTGQPQSDKPPRGKRTAGETSDPTRAKKRESDKAYRTRARVSNEQIKSQRDDLQTENEHLRLLHDPLLSALNLLKQQIEILKCEKQEKDELREKFTEKLEREYEQLKIDSREREQQANKKQEALVAEIWRLRQENHKKEVEKLEALISAKAISENEKKQFEREIEILRAENQSLKTQILQLEQSMPPPQFQNQYGNPMETPFADGVGVFNQNWSGAVS